MHRLLGDQVVINTVLTADGVELSASTASGDCVMGKRGGTLPLRPPSRDKTQWSPLSARLISAPPKK